MQRTSGTQMSKKSFNAADEVRSFAHGHLDVVDVGGHSVGRATFEPGWRWAESVKPIVGTELCEVEHLGCVVSGRMRVKTREGTELEFGPGDAMYLQPGHDAWIVGDEPCVVFDFVGFKNYAKK